MHRRLLWGLLTVLAAALVLFVMRHDPATLTRLGRFDLSLLAEKLALILFGAVLVLALFRERLSHSLETGLIWIVVALLLVVGYSYRTELRDVADHVVAQFAPTSTNAQERAVEITRGRGGDFGVPSQVNGARIAMVLDTGASAVVLTYEAARAAGLPLEVLNYSVNVDTANGRARAAPVTLDRLAIGNVTERSVSALIAPPGQLKTSLLGMSFLNRLESWEVRGDRLVMRGYP